MLETDKLTRPGASATGVTHVTSDSVRKSAGTTLDPNLQVRCCGGTRKRPCRVIRDPPAVGPSHGLSVLNAVSVTYVYGIETDGVSSMIARTMTVLRDKDGGEIHRSSVLDTNVAVVAALPT